MKESWTVCKRALNRDYIWSGLACLAFYLYLHVCDSVCLWLILNLFSLNPLSFQFENRPDNDDVDNELIETERMPVSILFFD